MFVFPILIGVLSIFSPSLALMLFMFYLAKALGPAILAPTRAMLGFFIAPFLMLTMSYGEAGSSIIAFDAIFGAGAVIYIFLISLRRSQTTTEAFLAAALMIIIVSIARMFIFRRIIEIQFQEGMQQVQGLWPQLFESMDNAQYMPLWGKLFPAFWGLGQVFALFLGLLLFHRAIKYPFDEQAFKFPIAYNALIMAILPLFLLGVYRAYILNIFILLCSIPLIQGGYVAWRFLSKVLSSGIIKGIIIVFIVLYAFIPLILIGYYDSWMSYNNNKSGGKPHESNTA